MSTYMQQELLIFFKTFLAGVILTASYDVLKILRNLLSHNSFFIGLEDLLYWCGAGIFLFSVIYLENDGVIRVYALAGVALGAFMYHEGPSGFLVRGVSVILSKVKRLLKIPLKPLLKCRKRLKFFLIRSKLFIDKQKSIQKVRKSSHEERKTKKSVKQDRND